MPKTATPKSVNLRAASTRTLVFGMLQCKVGTGPAADVSARESAKLIDPNLLTPLKQVYVNDNGSPVPFAERARGYERNGGYVVLSPDEKPDEVDSDGTIKLTHNVESVPAEYITGTALVWPAEKASDDAYALVAQYLAATGRAFIGTTVASGTTKVVAIRWSVAWQTLVMQTLLYDAQVRHANIATIQSGLSGIAAPEAPMAAMAAKLFGTLPEAFDYGQVRDEYGERLTAAIDAKQAGKPVAKGAPASEAPVTDDLMAALEASLAAAQA